MGRGSAKIHWSVCDPHNVFVSNLQIDTDWSGKHVKSCKLAFQSKISCAQFLDGKWGQQLSHRILASCTVGELTLTSSARSRSPESSRRAARRKSPGDCSLKKHHQDAAQGKHVYIVILYHHYCYYYYCYYCYHHSITIALTKTIITYYYKQNLKIWRMDMVPHSCQTFFFFFFLYIYLISTQHLHPQLMS